MGRKWREVYLNNNKKRKKKNMEKKSVEMWWHSNSQQSTGGGEHVELDTNNKFAGSSCVWRLRGREHLLCGN